MPPDSLPLLEPLIDAAKLPPLIEPAKTALVIIDIQEDFVSPTGAAGQWGIDLSILDKPLDNVDALIAAARAKGVTLAYARVVTQPETDSDALKALHARKGQPPQAIDICRAGTPGVDYYRVKPEPGDIEIQKLLYSTFVGTDFDEQLRARGIDNLVIVGFTTECCVDCTARDAFHRNYDVFIVTDATAAYDEVSHYGALNGLGKNCALLTDTQSVLKAWS
jgi:nicotinamidase-related amidase